MDAAVRGCEPHSADSFWNEIDDHRWISTHGASIQCSHQIFILAQWIRSERPKDNPSRRWGHFVLVQSCNIFTRPGQPRGHTSHIVQVTFFVLVGDRNIMKIQEQTEDLLLTTQVI